MSAGFAYIRPTPIGDARILLTLGDDALVYASDDPFEPGRTEVRWDRITDACTATIQTGVGGPGAPDAASWAPSSLEWLLVSVRGDPGTMWRLPDGDVRDAIVAALRARLGARWLGERLPLKDAQQKLGPAATTWNIPKLILLLVAVIALLIGAILVLALLLTPFVLAPVSAIVGVLLCRHALARLRTTDAAERLAPTSTDRATPGLVRLQGRAASDNPTTSPATGRPCVWWDVTVSVEVMEEGDETWREVAFRHGGRIDIATIEDEGGRLPVWLDGAALVLDHDTWDAPSGALPAAGQAFLAGLGYPWNGAQRIRVVEERLEVGATLTVVGTANARRELPARSAPTLIDRIKQSIVTGSWRRDLIRAVPSLLKAPMAIAIGYIGMMFTISVGRFRAPRIEATEPPAVAPDALVVWQGRDDAPFLVSNRPIGDALRLARQRALLAGAAGIAAVVFAIYDVVAIFR